MFIIRPALILLVVFGTLFYFQEPLKQLPEKFDALHSPYAASFKEKFKGILNASSTTVLNDLQNYIPTTGTTTPGTSSPVTNANSTTSNVLGDTQGVQPKNDLLPVVSNQITSDVRLSVSGIVSFTNKERVKLGLPYLALDTKLSKAAESKLQDMFQNQYFQHVSPSGESVSDVAKKAGYEYIVVGENLALGIFGGDDQVVAAWMASPGHKKNILDTRYRDIGVAVGQGMYQGKRQWLIVQHFGKPLSACALPNDDLKKRIESEKTTLGYTEARLTALKAEIDQLTGDAYTAKATEYNTIVAEYNSQLAILKKSIDEYNVTARVFNTCAGITAE
ncbi:MAG: hypothetical protein FGM57_01460 [Candidatus Taylorbacteria bacterium]|nr:hypothetical protein [Candidatus Taylorbacteria bacterium]